MYRSFGCSVAFRTEVFCADKASCPLLYNSPLAAYTLSVFSYPQDIKRRATTASYFRPSWRRVEHQVASTSDPPSLAPSSTLDSKAAQASSSSTSSGSLLQRGSHTLSLLRAERREKLSRSQWRHKQSVASKHGTDHAGRTQPPSTAALPPVFLPPASTSSIPTGTEAVPLECLFREAVRTARLEAHGRSLDVIPAHLCEPPPNELVCVGLACNRLTSFPTFLLHHHQKHKHGSRGSSLRSVLLANNRLERLPEPDQLADCLSVLSLLDVSGNSLAKVPIELFFLPRLEVLLLARNRIETLPTPTPSASNLGADHQRHSLCALHELDLSHNRLAGVPPSLISQFTGLRALNIAHNRLSELHEDLPSALTSLIRLDLSCNELTRIPPSYFSLFVEDAMRMRRIERFDVGRNPLTSPPMSVVRRGMGRVARWLEDEMRRRSQQSLAQSRQHMVHTRLDFGEPSIVVHRPRLPTTSSGTQTVPSSSHSDGEKVENGDAEAGAESQRPIRGSDSGYASNVDDQQQKLAAPKTREELKPTRLLRAAGDDKVVSAASHSKQTRTRLVAPRASAMSQPRSLGVTQRSVATKPREGSLPVATTASTSAVVANRAGSKPAGSPEAGSRAVAGTGTGRERRNAEPTAGTHSVAASRSPRGNEVVVCPRGPTKTLESAPKFKSLSTLNGSRSKVTPAVPLSSVVKKMCSLLEAKCKNGRELKLPNEPRKLAAALANGVVLCEFVNALRPKSAPEVHLPRTNVPLHPTKAHKNAEAFLAACELCGVGETKLCSNDILEGRKLQGLAELITALGKKNGVVNGSPNKPVDK